MKSIDEIEKSICNLFEVTKEDLYSRELKQNASNARHYLWLILHCHYGFSNLSIARKYKRARVTVIQYITQLKFRIKHQREDKEIYAEIKKIL